MTQPHETDTQVEDYFAREKRKRRWIALTEDGAIFGLVPAEEVELKALVAEFGEYKREEQES